MADLRSSFSVPRRFFCRVLVRRSALFLLNVTPTYETFHREDLARANLSARFLVRHCSVVWLPMWQTAHRILDPTFLPACACSGLGRTMTRARAREDLDHLRFVGELLLACRVHDRALVLAHGVNPARASGRARLEVRHEERRGEAHEPGVSLGRCVAPRLAHAQAAVALRRPPHDVAEVDLFAKVETRDKLLDA